MPILDCEVLFMRTPLSGCSENERPRLGLGAGLAKNALCLQAACAMFTLVVKE
jgi:hypothetical protein